MIDRSYREKLGRKWIISIVVGIVVGLSGILATPTIFGFSKSSYDRAGVDSIADSRYGNTSVTEAITSEILIVSYDYNA